MKDDTKKDLSTTTQLSPLLKKATKVYNKKAWMSNWRLL